MTIMRLSNFSISQSKGSVVTLLTLTVLVLSSLTEMGSVRAVPVPDDNQTPPVPARMDNLLHVQVNKLKSASGELVDNIKNLERNNFETLTIAQRMAEGMQSIDVYLREYTLSDPQYDFVGNSLQAVSDNLENLSKVLLDQGIKKKLLDSKQDPTIFVNHVSFRLQRLIDFGNNIGNDNGKADDKEKDQGKLIIQAATSAKEAMDKVKKAYQVQGNSEEN
ncbi:hypothetical protein IE53DRAFT_410757 [Violaceomyces palustris]|uniref:Uncharacterized protein n=1 Tax=Violaceomyces palustris TaxID=1673888 RepID=A0ACD0NXT8_9BASI|nr:hypothetical protein IE53DRAFT_410757 [Violaceomyces palustris]